MVRQCLSSRLRRSEFFFSLRFTRLLGRGRSAIRARARGATGVSVCPAPRLGVANGARRPPVPWVGSAALQRTSRRRAHWCSSSGSIIPRSCPRRRAHGIPILRGPERQPDRDGPARGPPREPSSPSVHPLGARRNSAGVRLARTLGRSPRGGESVGEAGFEPATTSTQSSCTTRLCDSPRSLQGRYPTAQSFARPRSAAALLRGPPRRASSVIRDLGLTASPPENR